MLSSTSSVSSSSITTEATDFGGGTLMEAYTPALKYVAMVIFCCYGNNGISSIFTSLREKMTRLEKENEILRRRLATDEQPHPSVLPQEDDGTDHMIQADKSLEE